ncbi:expressed unknown protein [Seminavis robusta]|uniref:Uncharacterized protein n=1 Tax=Seminavis robusta TaxID=568900 RepID=A0A9N8DFF3_9STRA|nr:expressed unknown protein [Seminavis robusta]|eukprot:Sro68_g038010.1 n/a (817) ;mRNA; f:39928-42378
MAVQHRRVQNPFRRGGRAASFGGNPRGGGLPTHYGGNGYGRNVHGNHSPFARLRNVCAFTVLGGLALYAFLGSSSTSTPSTDGSSHLSNIKVPPPASGTTASKDSSSNQQQYQRRDSGLRNRVSRSKTDSYRHDDTPQNYHQNQDSKEDETAAVEYEHGGSENGPLDSESSIDHEQNNKIHLGGEEETDPEHHFDKQRPNGGRSEDHDGMASEEEEGINHQHHDTEDEDANQLHDTEDEQDNQHHNTEDEQDNNLHHDTEDEQNHDNSHLNESGEETHHEEGRESQDRGEPASEEEAAEEEHHGASKNSQDHTGDTEEHSHEEQEFGNEDGTGDHSNDETGEEQRKDEDSDIGESESEKGEDSAEDQDVDSAEESAATNNTSLAKDGLLQLASDETESSTNTSNTNATISVTNKTDQSVLVGNVANIDTAKTNSRLATLNATDTNSTSLLSSSDASSPMTGADASEEASPTKGRKGEQVALGEAPLEAASDGSFSKGKEVELSPLHGPSNEGELEIASDGTSSVAKMEALLPLHGPANKGELAPWEEAADANNNFQPLHKNEDLKNKETKGSPKKQMKKKKVPGWKEAEMEMFQPIRNEGGEKKSSDEEHNESPADSTSDAALESVSVLGKQTLEVDTTEEKVSKKIQSAKGGASAKAKGGTKSKKKQQNESPADFTSVAALESESVLGKQTLQLDATEEKTSKKNQSAKGGASAKAKGGQSTKAKKKQQNESPADFTSVAALESESVLGKQTLEIDATENISKKNQSVKGGASAKAKGGQSTKAKEKQGDRLTPAPARQNARLQKDKKVMTKEKR